MVIDYVGLKAILDELPLGVLLVGETGEIPLCNDQAARFLEADPLDLMQSGVAALPMRAGLSEAMERLRQPYRQKERLTLHLGRKWISVTLVKAGISLFTEPCILVLVADTTEQRKLEDCVALFQGEFMQRLRGPLTSIKTSLSFLGSDSLPLPESLKEIVSLGYAEVQRLHSRVQSMGELVALESHAAEADLYLENVDLSAFLRKFLDRFRKTPEAQGREITLDLGATASPSKVVADYEKLGSVLSHVLQSALARSESPGRIHIRLISPATGMAEIQVEDSAPALPAGAAERTLEKSNLFGEKLKREETESALDLYLARAYSELMGGAFGLKNGAAVGNTVMVRMPTAPEEGWTG